MNIPTTPEEALVWINDPKLTSMQRKARKALMHPILYGTGPVSIKEFLESRTYNLHFSAYKELRLWEGG